MGSALMTLDLPVTKTTSALLAMNQDEVSLYEPSACIRCGRCLDVCPSLLKPQTLYKLQLMNTEAFTKIKVWIVLNVAVVVILVQPNAI